uniref:Non-specific serine/threonine protein kinase n=1 Tax=Alexandrium monilatum TaxID=311494 RepID=A0A7S4RWQ1_9DINO
MGQAHPAMSPSCLSGLKGNQAGDVLVQVDSVIARRGPIPISGRYTCSGRIEDDYTVEDKVLGSGLSGPVLLAASKVDAKQYAVKSFKKSGLSSRLRAELRNEAELYLTLDHPHVARLEMVYETDDDLQMVMEYMQGGELYDRLAQRKQYTEEGAAATAYQMLLAVAYLHAHKVAHRDLKLENFLYQDRTGDHLKLIDFGFAKFWDPTTKMSQSCGSLHYVAPEVLAHSYTTQADMWSLGIIMYMLLTGTTPFRGSEEQIAMKIKSGNPYYCSRFFKLSEQAQAFVRALLVHNPARRLTASAALEHPWVMRRNRAQDTFIGQDILASLRSFARASHFRRVVLSMMAWSLSTEDVADLREQFLFMDLDKRGTITLSELRQTLQERFHVDGAEAQALFESLDTDNDQEIEYHEFLAGVLLGRVRAHEDMLRKTFARFDRSRTGMISCQDLRSVLGDTFDGVDLKELMREADTKGDGKIDYDEFIACLYDPEPACAGPPVARSGSLRDVKPEQVGTVIDRLVAKGMSDPDSEKPVSRTASCLSGMPILLGSQLRGDKAVEPRRRKP